MDPAGFGAMVIAPAARFLAFFGPFGSRAGVRSPFAARSAAGLALVPGPLTARLAARPVPERAGSEPARTARSYAWPDAYAVRYLFVKNRIRSVKVGRKLGHMRNAVSWAGTSAEGETR